MNLTDPGDIANVLKQGKRCPGVPSWLLAEAAQFIADEMASATTSLTWQETCNVVRLFNEHCHFDLTCIVARSWIDRHGFHFTIQKRLTQALINRGLLDEAEKFADEGIRRCGEFSSSDATAGAELSEYRGLLGRIAKQRFVNTGDPKALFEATNRYFAEYRRDGRSYWHGINALACMAADSTPPADPSLRGKLAQEILATVHESYASKPSSWAAATASEANLALRNCDAAELWLHRFLAREDTWPFNVDSYARQLREVWGGDALSAMSCADRLCGIISRYIARAQSRVTITPSQAVAVKANLERNGGAEFEKNFLGESSFTVNAIRSLLKAFESIGCVTNKSGERLGTGFLIRGSWFRSDFGDSPVFVTNAHVISDTVAKAITAENARVTFELDAAVNGQQRQYKVAELLFTSPPGKLGVFNPNGGELDCTIVRLDGLPDDVAPLSASENLPLISPRTKVFVAGHPRGAGLQIALHDSLLLDIDDDWRLVHYRTPTDPGSSGSPVFNMSWQVIALHHAGTSTTPRLHGTGTYEANEGISMAAIRRKLSA